MCMEQHKTDTILFWKATAPPDVLAPKAQEHKVSPDPNLELGNHEFFAFLEQTAFFPDNLGFLFQVFAFH